MGAFIPVLAPIFKKLLINFIVSAITSKIFGKKSAKGKGAGAQSSSQIMINKSSNNDPIPLVYGRQRVGGTRAFVDTTDGAGDSAGNTHLNMVIVLAEGEVGVPYRIFFGDQVIWWNESGTDPLSGLTNSGTVGQYSPISSGGYSLTGFLDSNPYGIDYMSFFTGTTTQTVDTTMQTSIGSGTWDNNRRLRGLSYIAMKLPFNEEYTGAAPEVFVEFQGSMVRTVTGSTLFTDLSNLVQGNEYTVTSIGTTTIAQWIQAGAMPSGSTSLPPIGTVFIANQGVDGSGTATQSALPPTGETTGRDQNPAEVLATYLTNTTYGKGIPDADIDWQSFYDAKIYFQVPGGSSRFKINGFLDTGAKLFDNIEEILASCNSMLVYSKGKYKLLPRKQSEASVFAFNESNIIGAIDITLPPKSAKFNKVEYTYNNVGTNFQDDIKIVDNSSYLTEDNGTVLLGRNETTLVCDETIVGNLATWMMNNSRYQETISFEAAHTAIDVEAGQVVDVTHPVVGYTAKKFRVQEVILTEEDRIKITAQEYTSSIQI